MTHTQGHRPGIGGQRRKRKPRGPFGSAPVISEKGVKISGRRQASNVKHAIFKIKGKVKRGRRLGRPKRLLSKKLRAASSRNAFKKALRKQPGVRV